MRVAEFRLPYSYVPKPNEMNGRMNQLRYMILIIKLYLFIDLPDAARERDQTTSYIAI